MATQAALRLDHVVKRFGDFVAVNDVSFEVRKGEIFGFLGPNGAGKTTTLRMLLDIIPLTEGKISVLGAPTAATVRRQIGYLPEERGLYRKMRAAESIAYFARLRGVPGPAAKARAVDLMEEFGLGDFARSKNEALSKGMAQKVQLLATIAHDPDLLILDEPFSGLDPLNQGTLEDLIRRMKDRGKTIIFSTHVMSHAERLCDRFLILAKGEKRFEGTLAEARAAFPPHLQVRTSAAQAHLLELPMATTVAPLTATPEPGGETDYQIELTAGADPQAFLKEAFARGLPISRFDAGNASLHDIFVAMAGDSPPAFLASPSSADAPAQQLEGA